MSVREIRVATPLPRFNLTRSFRGQRFGLYDPTARLETRSLRKAYHGPEGLMVASVVHADERIVLRMEGPGADGELDRWASMWPPSDGYDAFEPQDAGVLRLHKMHHGLRLFAHPWMFDVACLSVLQQRVTWEEALRAWRRLTRTMGQEVSGLAAFPSPDKLARINPRTLGPLDVDYHRAKAIIGLARAELARPFLRTPTPFATLRERLAAIPGVGPWTTEFILGAGAGDSDALPTGDLHMPNTVAWALAGEPRGTDKRMVELLEPYRGHRFRVIALLRAAKVHAPSFAPKKPRRPPR